VDFANLFTTTQAGELLYFLIAVSLSLAAFLVAVEQRTRSKEESAARRYMAALAGVVAAWGVLTVGNLYTLLQPDANADLIIPPLERAVTTVVILLLAWAFLTAESPYREDGSRWGLAALVILLALGYVLTVLIWREAVTTQTFNQHPLGVIWTVIPMLFLLGGMALLFERYSFAADIPLKLLFLGVVLVGHAYTLYEMGAERLQGHLAGTLRLAMLAALPLVPIIVYRMVIDRFRQVVSEATGWVELQVTPPQAMPPAPIAVAKAPAQAAAPAPMVNPHSPQNTQAYREAISLLKILGVMLEKTAPHEIPQQIIKAVAQTFKADVVAVATLKQAHWADTIAVYQFIKDQFSPGLVISMESQPTLAHAIELNLQMILLPTRNHDELADLFHRLDIPERGVQGPAYFQPLSKDRKVIGMLMVALPYTARLLTDEERALLEGLAPIAARLMSISRTALEASPPASLPEMADANATTGRIELQSKLEAAQTQVEGLNRQIGELNVQLQKEREKLERVAHATGDMSITQQIRLISKEREGLAEERENLVKALQGVNTVLATATADRDDVVYQSMLDSMNQERANLLREKQRLERELADLRAMPRDQDRLQEVINTLSAERDRVLEEQQRLKSDVQRANQQLSELGLEEGILGFTQLLAHLTEERNRFQNMSKRALAERDRALRQLDDLHQQREQEQGRTQQISTLQTDLSRLAADREAVLRQRDALKSERDLLNQQREDWLAQRIQLTEEYEKMRAELERGRAALQKALEVPPAVGLGTEPANAEQFRKLQRRLDEVEDNRSDLEFALLKARQDLELYEAEVQRLTNAMYEFEEAPAKPSETHDMAEMIVGLSQELRTPLTSIVGYTDLILGESTGILGETQRQFMLRIKVNTEQLILLVENLLRVLAIDYGNLILTPRKVNVEDLIDDAITASSAQYREKGLNLQLNVMPQLPDLMADRDAMQQILTRLLSNAYLASPADGSVNIQARYEAEYRRHPDDPAVSVILFAITDQGGGIAAEDAERVFNRHYRAENPLIQGLGDKGAGLSIARALALAHGGDIWFHSEAGRSTTFTVMMPVDHHFGDNEMLRSSIRRLIDVLEK
jgi:signal transduction histidine kinase